MSSHIFLVVYEVLTAVVIKISIFWDITPCGSRWKSTNVLEESEICLLTASCWFLV
jgi:hypothetical protein